MRVHLLNKIIKFEYRLHEKLNILELFLTVLVEALFNKLSLVARPLKPFIADWHRA